MLQTDNLPVKLMASRSRYAAEGNHERFAAGPRQILAPFQTENPTVVGSRLISTPGLSHQGSICQNRHSKCKKNKAHHHELFPFVDF
jgi:hypothetical protein